MKKIIICVAFLGILPYLPAQSKWTLRQCINYAIDNNIEIKQQELQVKNSEIDLSTSKNSRLPDLSASLGAGFSFGQVVNATTNTNVTTNASSANLNVSTSLPLFTGFRIPNQIKMDKLNLQSSIEGLRKAKENMELQVTSYYLDVLFKKEILKVYQDQAELSRSQVDKTQILVDAGKVPLSQLYDIKAQLAKDELNITTAQNDYILSLLNLSQVLNLPEMTGFDIEEPVTSNVVKDNIASILPPQEVYQIALGIKPHIKTEEYKLEGLKKSFEVAKADYYPTLSFNASYSTSLQRQYGYDNRAFADQFRDNGREYFGVSMNIPIFNRFQTRNRVKVARLNILNQSLVLDNTKLTLYKEIQQAYQSAVAAESKLTSTEKALEAAKESYRYAEERYSIGKSTVFELNESQTKLLTSRSEQVQAKYDFLFRAKILDFYRGEPIDIN